MNEYIFDWEENCRKIIQTKRYTTNSHQFREQAVLFRYLHNLGKTKDEIFDFWKTTDSKLLQQANNDEEDINYIFGKLWSASSYWKMTSNYSIKIYQQEIDYINSLPVYLWLKQYLLALLCIYKFYGKKWCKYDSKIKAFCFSVTSAKREREEHKEKIKNCLEKYHPYELSLIDTTVSFKINFLCKDIKATPIKEILNPRYIEEIIPLIKNERKCEQCGEVFTYSSQTLSATLCESCRRKQRHKQQYLCHKKANQQASANLYNMKDLSTTE